MTENYTGAAVAVLVGGDPDNPTALLASPTAARDAVLVTNNTPGTRVFCDDAEEVSRQFAVAPGETITLPFASGQVYAYATATTAEGETLDEAEVMVRPILVGSALERDLALSNASLVSTVMSRTSSAPSGYAFDLVMVQGTKYFVSLGNAFRVPFGNYEVEGMTLQPRKVGAAELFLWLTLSLDKPGEAGQGLIIEADEPPAGTFLVDIVAVSGSTELATLRGRIKVS